MLSHRREHSSKLGAIKLGLRDGISINQVSVLQMIWRFDTSDLL